MHSPRASDWTSDLEGSLATLHDYCAGYTWMYSRDVQVYTRRSYYLDGAVFILSSLTSLLNTIKTVFSVDSQVFEAINIVISWLALTCFTASYLKDYSTLIKELNNHKAEYTELAGNIDRQLQLPKEDREKAEDFHRWVSSYYQLLGRYAIEILPKTIEDYRVQAKKDSMPFPDELLDSYTKRLSKKDCQVSQDEKKDEKKIDINKSFRRSEINPLQLKYELNRFKEHEDV